MELYPASGSETQIRKRQARPSLQAGLSESGQRDLLRGARRLFLETFAEGLRPLANSLWVIPALDAGLDVAIYSRALRECLRKTEGRKAAPTAAIIDSQSVKVGDQAGERGYDVGKKVSGRKRQVVVAILGWILAVTITRASVQGREAAKDLISFLVEM